MSGSHGAYYIDAKARKIKAVVIPRTLEALQEAVGGYIEAAHRFENEDVVYVNEEGLLRDPLPADWFCVKGAHQPFAGNGIMVGQDSEGVIRAPLLSLAEVYEMVRFIDLATINLLASLPGPAVEKFMKSLHSSPQQER